MPNNDTEVEDAVVDDDTAVGVAAIDDETEVEDAAVDDDDDDGDVDIETASGRWENLVKEVDNLPRQKSAVEAKAAGKIDLYAGGPYRLLVAETIRKILATSPHLFLLNGMYASRIALGSRKAATTATITELTPLSATNEVYRLAARIHALKEVRSGVWEDRDVPVPADAVLLALAEPEKIGLRSICGVTSAPLLREGGDIRYDDGFDEDAEVWCHNVPKLCILDSPAYGDAKVALWYIRDNFKTFPFGDAETVFHPGLGVPVVDLGQPIGMDETTFLNALLTAACRANLFLAPGWALTAPEGGGGSGKGLLIQSVSQIAFGISPHPNTHNGDDKEFDKRIAGAYKSGSPVVYIDNVNSTMLKSDSLASKVTERPFIIRVLGETGDYVIDSSAWVVITGNGLK